MSNDEQSSGDLVSGKCYIETFEEDAGGWYGWNADGAAALEIRDGAAITRSPWWVDYNHAPPGAGYLHILFALDMHEKGASQEVEGENRFIRGKYPTDFTDARLTFRIRGDMEQKGSQLVLLVQSDITEPVQTRVNSVLSSQPIDVTEDWSEQTITCVPDDGQWTCLGSRHSRMELYGWGPIAPVLKDVTCDIILVLFPLTVEPVEDMGTDRHRLRPGRDYPYGQSTLPEGRVMLDTVKIEFP